MIMGKFNLNKLRGAGLRYIVRDRSGQLWAHELMPVREDGYWRLADAVLCPQKISGHTNEAFWDEYNRFWAWALNWRLQGREFCTPLKEMPLADIAWEDEPFDLVTNGFVSDEDMKKWTEVFR